MDLPRVPRVPRVPRFVSSDHSQQRPSISSPSPHYMERNELGQRSGGDQPSSSTNNSSKTVILDRPSASPESLQDPEPDQPIENLYQMSEGGQEFETDEPVKDSCQLLDEQQDMVGSDQPAKFFQTPSSQKRERTRQMELHSLLQRLSGGDRRYIRMELNSQAVTNDLLLIPVELQMMIFHYLDVQDIFSTQRVSKAWCKAFSTEKFCDEMNHRFYPTDWTKHCLTFVKSGKYNANKWFRRSTTRLIQRRLGRYHSTRIYYHAMNPPDKIRPPQPDLNNDHQYCNGRLAIHVRPERDAISVKSLHKEASTLVFMDENRRIIDDWLLSDRYLLYSPIASSTIFAINLASDLEEPPSRINLPNNNFRIQSALENRVAVSTHNEGFVIWHIGGSVRALDTSEITRRFPNHKSSVCGLFFHPTKPECCIVVQQFDPLAHSESREAIRKHFIVVSYYSNFRLAKVKVGKGINQKDKEQIYQFPLYSKTADARRVQMQSLHEGNICISNIDSFLLHPDCQPLLPAVYDPSEKRLGVFNPPHREPHMFLKFDIHRAEFEIQFFQYPSLLMRTPSWRNLRSAAEECDDQQVFIWREQALLPFYATRRDGKDVDGVLSHLGNAPPGVDAVLLTALDTASPRTNTNLKIPWHYSAGSYKQPTNHYWLRPVDKVDLDCHVAYKLIGEAKFATEAAQIIERDEEWSFDHSRKVLGDDDFVILTGPYGFVVWCFDKEVALPHVDSLESKKVEYLKYWKKMPHPFGVGPHHLEEI